MDKIKVLSVSKTCNPCCLGGVETFQRNLKKFFKEDISFLVFKRERKKYFDVEDVEEIDYKSSIFSKLFVKIFKLKRYFAYIIKHKKFDVLIIDTPNDLKVLKNINKPIILVQHININEYYSNGTYTKQETINLVKKYLSYYVFLSEESRDLFVEKTGFDLEKTKVIRHYSEMELLKEKKIKSKKLVMVCRLSNKQKRLDLAIKAMKKLDDFTLEIYGDGEDKELLENIIKENKIKNVFLCGGTSQVKEKLDRNAIFIMTSDFEGYGITNIEAMRRGLPIVLRSTFESALDIVKDNGVLLDKEWNEDEFVEAIRKIYDNYDYYSSNSLKLGERYNREIIEKEWKELIYSCKKCINTYN